MTNGYELKLERYQGPMDKLLELIEEKKLEVTELSLAQVTSDFLKYVEVLESEKMIPGMNVLIADFLLTASRLILIKSRVLIPAFEVSEEEEEDIRDLESRLRIYKEFKGAKDNIKNIWSDIPKSFTREFLASLEPVFLPPEDISKNQLSDAVRRICVEVEKFYETSSAARKKIVNLKEKIQEIISAVKKEPVVFQAMTGGRSREEVVVFFLAILHLVRRKELNVSQMDFFKDIRIARRVDND